MADQKKHEGPTIDSGALAAGKLSPIYVFALAAGSIFTFIGYWDSVFISYAGPATFFAFGLMTLLILPIAFNYAELTPIFPHVGGELVFNTVGISKHVGFFSSWLIMAAWIAVPPAGVMGIIQWISHITGFDFGANFVFVVVIAIIVLFLYCILNLLNVEISGKIQVWLLVAQMGACIITALIIFLSGHWNIDNFKPFFQSVLGDGGFGGWVIGLGLLVTPFFGFETVPQLMEESNFDKKYSSRIIWGSVVACGAVYVIFFGAVCGVDSWSNLLANGADEGFLTILAIENLGWGTYAIIFGILSVVLTLATCVLGFWMAAARLMYAMGRQNFLPKVFSKTNRWGQPLLPNFLITAVCIVFILLMNATSFMKDFFNLMAFGAACAYTCTMISNIRIHMKHPEWESTYHLKGGYFMRFLGLICAITAAVLCTLGQEEGSWRSFAVYFAIGIAIWIWMVIYKWRRTPVIMRTPDGEKEY